jgi:hypothetical protein
VWLAPRLGVAHEGSGGLGGATEQSGLYPQVWLAPRPGVAEDARGQGVLGHCLWVRHDSLRGQ